MSPYLVTLRASLQVCKLKDNITKELQTENTFLKQNVQDEPAEINQKLKIYLGLSDQVNTDDSSVFFFYRNKLHFRLQT